MRKGIVLSLTVLLIWVTGSVAFGGSKDIPLAAPKLGTGVDLLTAFKMRQSTRGFAAKEVSLGDLSTVLWAANGINRADGGRTAPAALRKYLVTIYVLADEGIYLYQPEKQLLKFLSEKKLKGQVSQADVGTAFYVLLFTAKLDEYPAFVKRGEGINFAYTTAGCIGENVYLMAGALKLGTRIVAGIKRDEIVAGLNLSKDEMPLFVMPLGYPKE